MPKRSTETSNVPANGRRRLRRGTLTAQLIVDAAMKILDDSDASKLTFSTLGRELGASPTAMYRHFSDREAILDAVGDRLVALSIANFEQHDQWENSLRDLAWRAWDTYALHPIAATSTYYRLTRQPNELRAVDAILGALFEAGLSLDQAALAYHMYSQFVLSQAANNAANIAEIRGRRAEHGSAEWEQVYEPSDPNDFPHYWAAKEAIRKPAHRAAFETQLEVFIDYVRRIAVQ